MIKTLSNILKQDREAFVIPKKVQDMIPIQTVWPDGIFMVGRNKYSKMYRFTDINYAVASREDREGMFMEYSGLLNFKASSARIGEKKYSDRQDKRPPTKDEWKLP